MQVPFIVWVPLYRALGRITLHIFDVCLVIDVRIDLLLPDQEFEFADLIAELSGYLRSKMTECLEVAYVHAIRVAIFWVHCRDHIDLKWLDIG